MILFFACCLCVNVECWVLSSQTQIDLREQLPSLPLVRSNLLGHTSTYLQVRHQKCYFKSSCLQVGSRARKWMDLQRQSDPFVYLCEELNERLVTGEVTDVFGVKVVQCCDVLLVHLVLL